MLYQQYKKQKKNCLNCLSRIKTTMKNKDQYIQIQTTVAKKSDAEKIAKMLLENKLSACIQIVGPMTSIYHWKGKIEKSQEWLCLIKSKKSHFKKIEQAIKKIHPYETPEIIATPIVDGSREYLKWMHAELL